MTKRIIEIEYCQDYPNLTWTSWVIDIDKPNVRIGTICKKTNKRPKGNKKYFKWYDNNINLNK